MLLFDLHLLTLGEAKLQHDAWQSLLAVLIWLPTGLQSLLRFQPKAMLCWQAFKLALEVLETCTFRKGDMLAASVTVDGTSVG